MNSAQCKEHANYKGIKLSYSSLWVGYVQVYSNHIGRKISTIIKTWEERSFVLTKPLGSYEPRIINLRNVFHTYLKASFDEAVMSKNVTETAIMSLELQLHCWNRFYSRFKARLMTSLCSTHRDTTLNMESLPRKLESGLVLLGGTCIFN